MDEFDFSLLGKFRYNSLALFVQSFLALGILFYLSPVIELVCVVFCSIPVLVEASADRFVLTREDVIVAFALLLLMFDF